MALSGESRLLYRGLKALADGELLLAWTANLPTIDSTPTKELRSAGLIFPYRAGRSRSRYCYLVGMYEPGDSTGPGSTLPPPSLQAAASWSMYRCRDCWTCHLCGRPVDNDWRRPNDFQSLDHFLPRSKGGLDYPSNIRLSHASCNKGRRNRDVVEFRAWLAAHRAGRALGAQEARA
jgi:hypothetical protein